MVSTKQSLDSLVLFYHIMFSCASLMSDLIACRKSILRGKRGKIIYPSHLNEKMVF